MLPLQVELGRFTNTPRNRRICPLCKAEVEDEIHFLFKCSNLQETRAKMYAKLPEILNYANLFDRLTFLTSKTVIFCNYLHELWQKQQQELNKV